MNLKVLIVEAYKAGPAVPRPTHHQLGQLITKLGSSPKNLVTDSRPQFTSVIFRPWCHPHVIRHRQWAVGKTGSIAVSVRFVLISNNSANSGLSDLPLVPSILLRDV